MGDTQPAARATGYLSEAYAMSFSDHGSAVQLPRSGSWLLQRRIGDTGLHDAMGCYPLFCCADWNGLQADVDALSGRVVSLVVVTDPMASVEPAVLSSAFGVVRSYKPSFVADMRLEPEAFVGRSHRQQALRSLRRVAVEFCPDPLEFLDDWVRLFDVLAERHAITGLRRFSREAFALQLAIPGMTMFRASVAGRTVGLDLWYVQDGVAQGHLAAFDEEGYRLRASYATKWRMLEYFHGRVAWVNLGAGKSAACDDGLSAFKRGFSTGTRPSWLCGRIFDPVAYEALVARHCGDNAAGDFFPLYRVAEWQGAAPRPMQEPVP